MHTKIVSAYVCLTQKKQLLRNEIVHVQQIHKYYTYTDELYIENKNLGTKPLI